MNAVIAKNDLSQLMGKILGVVPSKPTVLSLANLLIKASENQITISATDLTVSMFCSTGATIIEEGAISLPAKSFARLIRELTSSSVKITTNHSGIAEITSGSSIFKIHGMGKESFPSFPDLSMARELSFTSASLKEMLSKTAFAAARDTTRYELNSIQLQIKEGQVVLIGTDGKRLAKITAAVQTESTSCSSYVIPLKAVEEMIKMLDDSDNKVGLKFTADKKIALEYANFSLITKLLSGPFPDVEKVIPAHSNHQISIHREELMILLRQVSLFTSESSHAVHFTFDSNQLYLSVANQELGEGRVSMPVEFSGKPLEIAFNPLFLLDILRHSKDETICFNLNDAHNPGLITDSTQAQFILMPMRLPSTAGVSLSATAT